MIKAENGEWFGEKLDKKSLNYLKLHGSKSLAKEKQILRDIKIQQKDVASFKSPSHLFDSSFAYILNKFTYKREEDKMFWWTVENLELIRRKYYLSDEQKLFIEIEQLRIQHLERTSCKDSLTGNIPKYESLKKSIEDKIKGLCDDCDRERRESLESGKLRVRHKRRDEAYQRIFKLYHVKLAEEKDGTVLDEMPSSEVGKFILQWNNNKAFRNYENYVLKSFEREQLCRNE
ncbi:hypothetical protein P8452_57768 [Trifolium repens]|nr:hypothetical protein P8452_57768 [Trifolium repens]